MSNHISTFNTALAGSVKLKIDECPFCLKKSMTYGTYYGIAFKACKHILDSEMWRGDIVKKRRELLGLNRPQMAKLVKRSKHTIKYYEYRKCPEWYLEQTELLIKEVQSERYK